MAPSVQPFSLSVTAFQVIDDMDSDGLSTFKKKEPDSMFDQWFFLPVCPSPRVHGFPATEKGLRLCAIAHGP